MSKHRIIPQMFDVRPVDHTGDLDWKKINSIGECDCDNWREEQRLFQFQEQASLFEQQQKARKEVQDYLKLAVQSREAALKEQRSRQKEMERRSREEIIRLQASRQQEALKKIAENNRRYHLAYEAAVKSEREKMAKEHEKWLKEEARLESLSRKNEIIEEKKIQEPERIVTSAEDISFVKTKKKNKWSAKNKIYYGENDFSWRDIFFPAHFSFQFDIRRSLVTFAIAALAVSLGVGSVSYASKGFGMKGKVFDASQEGMTNITAAISDMAAQNFEGSSQQFAQAYANFSEASQQLEDMGSVFLDSTRFIPFASKISSGKNAVEAGKHFSAAGKSLNEVVKIASELKNPMDTSAQNKISLLDVLGSFEKNIADAKTELDSAQQNLDKISLSDLPEDKQDEFLLLKQKLPAVRDALDLFLNNGHILSDLFGANGPRKYLFLFQNNSEMRPTGGFIGSYGLLDITNGRVKNFFIDGIFNPDGQLKDKIVPPAPIQKISVAWSLHDSNWFPDFPTSARKAIQFYEKTGGPTTDGIITFTPTLMKKLLAITGPIDMPDYGVTLNADNFTEKTQYEVEVDYDKERNQPKKILADLAPLILEKLLSSGNPENISKTAEAFLSGLNEKHILLYSQNPELQKLISEQGWSGEILPAAKDYLSVINTNINGFKTDAVIDENIDHSAEIQSDGSVVDTVTITRKHNGGSSEYDWFNKVNADYMRVYVPQGSKLLSASGQTREIDKPPLDYDALGFKRDSDVQKEENSTTIDPESGTIIYDEAGKTVFANWTYVSPQETTTITYKYLLPVSLFRISVEDAQQVDSYSLVAQKQSGSVGSSFVSHISYPESYAVKWSFPDNSEKNTNELKNESLLTTDRFEGAVFEKTQ